MKDEFAEYITKIKNRFWSKIPQRFKLLTAIFYVILGIAIPFGITWLVGKGCDRLNTDTSQNNGDIPTDEQALPLKDKSPQQIPPTENKQGFQPIEHKHGLQNGGFEEGLKYWFFDYRPQFATPPTVTGDSPNGHINPNGRAGNCLHIGYNEQQKKFNVTLFWYQKIYGLTPNAKYNLTFYIKGEINSRESLRFHIGDDWEVKERSLYIDENEKFSDWRRQSGQLTIGDYSEAILRIISKDICDIYIDDIAFSKAEE